MTDRQPYEVTNLDRYGSAPLPWTRPHDLLDKGALGPEVPVFLGTAGAGGVPHAAGIGVAWLDGEVYLTSGPQTRKSRHLASRPACTISMRLEGIDLVLEGEAAKVTDRGILEQVAGLYRAGGWPAEIEGEALTAPYSAPSAGPPPWELYRFTFHTAYGVATTEPFGATRWKFSR